MIEQQDIVLSLPQRRKSDNDHRDDKTDPREIRPFPPCP